MKILKITYCLKLLTRMSTTQNKHEIPVGILKNSEFCFSELTKCVNKAFNKSKLPDTLKLSDIVPIFKKLDPTDKNFLDQLVFYLYCLKCLKKLCMINFMNKRRDF